jgi:AbrB family looped-hinge helix DNA binding protein
MTITTVTEEGQLVLPEDVRDLLRLSPGDRVELVPDGTGGVTMRKARVLSVTDLFGRFPTNGVTATVEEMKEAAREEAVEGVMRSMRP